MATVHTVTGLLTAILFKKTNKYCRINICVCVASLSPALFADGGARCRGRGVDVTRHAVTPVLTVVEAVLGGGHLTPPPLPPPLTPAHNKPVTTRSDGQMYGWSRLDFTVTFRVRVTVRVRVQG